MDALLDEGIKVAGYLLEKNSEFFPFAVVMTTGGEVKHIQGWTGEEQPPSMELINLILSGLKRSAQAGEYRTTALISDVRVRQQASDLPTDTVCLQIEDS